MPNVPLQISKRYILKKELGKGAYGTVYFAVDKRTGEEGVDMGDDLRIELLSSESTTCSAQRLMLSGRFEKSLFCASVTIPILPS